MRYMKLRIHADGACDNNSKLKLMGAGIAVYVEGTLVGGSGEPFGGSGTSNIAEYEGLMMALKEAIKCAQHDTIYYNITIVGDSQLIIKQMLGEWKIKNPTLRDLYEEAKVLEVQLKANTHVKTLDYKWVPRERNTEADKYSKIGLAKNFE